jgi:voltage-gated potassium channel
MPRRAFGPLPLIMWRLALALSLVLVAAVVVYAGREGYHDSAGRPLDWLSSFYYSAVTLTTIGYGDIVPVSPDARLVNTLVIAPLRLGFLLLLVGTTLRALTERTRAEWREERWRSKVRGHAVVVGYGTKGRAAVVTLLANGCRPHEVVVVDTSAAAVAEANRHGVVGVIGDGTHTDVLERAELGKAKHVLIATKGDDAAVLTALTARRMNGDAMITASVRHAENAAIMRESGATNVITSSESAGHLLGVATLNPTVGSVMEDLLSSGLSMKVVERAAAPDEIGGGVEGVREPVLALVRDGRAMRYNDPLIGTVRAGDQLILVRSE